jgi:MFS family permease
VFGAVAGAGGAVGLLLGGVLTDSLGWRWCLYVNLLFSAVACAGAVLVPRQARERGAKVDVPGAVSVVAALFALVHGFAHAGNAGWSSTGTWGSIVAGLVLLAVFVVVQKHAEHQLLPLRLPLDRDRGASYIAVFLCFGGLFGVNLLLTYYVQQVLGYSPTRTGLAFLPQALTISSTLASWCPRAWPCAPSAWRC